MFRVAQCEACTVIINAAPQPTSHTPTSASEGSNITTFEGLAGPIVAAVQAA